MFLSRYREVFPYGKPGRSIPDRDISETEVIEVSTGEVKTAEGSVILNASALGSCIALVAFDPVHQRGGIAHIMLPGRARNDQDPNRHRYAENGINALFSSLRQKGSRLETVRICMAGAANVLKRADDTVCAGNIISVRDIIAASGYSFCAESVGGELRRRVRLNLPLGRVECAIGDNPAFCLWEHANDQHC